MPASRVPAAALALLFWLCVAPPATSAPPLCDGRTVTSGLWVDDNTTSHPPCCGWDNDKFRSEARQQHGECPKRIMAHVAVSGGYHGQGHYLTQVGGGGGGGGGGGLVVVVVVVVVVLIRPRTLSHNHPHALTLSVTQVGGHACTCQGVRQMRWVPSSCELAEWNATTFCKALGDRKMVMIGDSTMEQVGM